MLKPDTYEFADDMCSEGGGSALCIDRNVTIEAEVAGSVVLDANKSKNVVQNYVKIAKINEMKFALESASAWN